MKLEILRVIRTPKCTVGVLRIDGAHQCFTLEDTARPSGLKLAGATAIPEGTFNLEITYSPKFEQDMPLIWNVEKDGQKWLEVSGVRFDGVRMHWGNTAAHTDGCPLVGKHCLQTGLGEYQVTESRAAYGEFFALLPKGIHELVVH